MSIWGALAGGFAGTLVLTTILRAASELRLTRIDLPFLLGTAFTANRLRAKALGYALHFLAGFVFALVYYAIFVAIDRSGWWLGAIFGLVHALFAGTALVNLLLPLVHPRMGSPLTGANTTALLEPPGFLMLNYGAQTPLVNIAAHVAYGTLVGGFTQMAS
jgi:ABC-type polysaccharide/polyol phosphate export permease